MKDVAIALAAVFSLPLFTFQTYLFWKYLPFMFF